MSEEKSVVKFVQSGVEAEWDDSCHSILELAEEHGLELEYGCRYGDCCTCLVPLVSGELTYRHEMMRPSDGATCLPCCSKPVGKVEIDA